MGVEHRAFLVAVIPYELRPLKTVMRKLFIFEIDRKLARSP